MSGFNQQKLNSLVRSSNATAILVGDQVIGLGQSIDISVSMGTEVFYAIGSANPQEIQPLKIGITASMTSLQLTDAGILKFGYSTTWLELLFNNQLSFNLIDRSMKTIISVVGAVSENYSGSHQCNQVITETVSFACMDILNAAGVSILQGNNAVDFNSLVSAAVSLI